MEDEIDACTGGPACLLIADARLEMCSEAATETRGSSGGGETGLKADLSSVAGARPLAGFDASLGAGATASCVRSTCSICSGLLEDMAFSCDWEEDFEFMSMLTGMNCDGFVCDGKNPRMGAPTMLPGIIFDAISGKRNPF